MSVLFNRLDVYTGTVDTALVRSVSAEGMVCYTVMDAWGYYYSCYNHEDVFMARWHPQQNDPNFNWAKSRILN